MLKKVRQNRHYYNVNLIQHIEIVSSILAAEQMFIKTQMTILTLERCWVNLGLMPVKVLPIITKLAQCLIVIWDLCPCILLVLQFWIHIIWWTLDSTGPRSKSKSIWHESPSSHNALWKYCHTKWNVLFKQEYSKLLKIQVRLSGLPNDKHVIIMWHLPYWLV